MRGISSTEGRGVILGRLEMQVQTEMNRTGEEEEDEEEGI